MLKTRFAILASIFLLIAVCFGLIGCGNPTGGGGGGGGTTFKIVDPYIVGARLYVDYDNDGEWEDGEPSSEASGPTGVFVFTTMPTMDGTLRICLKGEHLGVTYEAWLSRPFSTLESGNIIVSPLTTLLAGTGVSSQEIVDILHTYASIEINVEDVSADPWGNLENRSGNGITETEIRKIKASICTYALVMIFSDIIKLGIEPYNISWETIDDNSGQVSQMGLAVNLSLSTTEIQTAYDHIAGGGWPVPPPPVTVGDVAKAAFVITDAYVKYAISTAPNYTFCPSIEPELVGPDLGVLFYCLKNKGNDVVQGGLEGHYFFYPSLYPGRYVTIEAATIDTAETFTLNDEGSIEIIGTNGIRYKPY